MDAKRVAVITGAGGGIGSAVALKLAAQGWALVLADRTLESLQDVRRRCRELGAAAEALAGDVASDGDVAGLVGCALQRHGRLDGFVCNAGIAGVVKPLPDYPEDVFRQVMDVNVLGTFLCLKHALPALHASGGGSFVAMASTSSIRGRAGLAAYVASKHAVLGLVRTAALENVGGAVRVNAVLPGPTRTAMIDGINAMAAGGPPVARAVRAPSGDPADVANTVAFLLSPDAAHMNGAALVLDAGSTLA